MGADLYGVNGAYFRDSYNSSNLLWQFGLSWWTDVIPLLKHDRVLGPAQARKLIRMLKRGERAFRKNIAGLEDKERAYFEKKRDEFRGFLEEAVKADWSIECSL